MVSTKTLKLDMSFRPIEVIDAIEALVLCLVGKAQFCVENLTIDHILPRSKGGKNTWKNLVTACKKCNQKKGNKTPEQANMFLIRAPFKPKTNILRNVNKKQISPIWKNYLWENYDE